MTPAGFPHSGTPGSKAVCASPGTIAACRALLRLPAPRHPPRAHTIFAFRLVSKLDPKMKLDGDGSHIALHRDRRCVYLAAPLGAYQVFANFRLMRIVLIPFGIVSMKRYAAVKVRGQRPEGRMLGRSGRVAPLLPESESDLDSESP